MGTAITKGLDITGIKELKKGANPFLGDFSEVLMQDTQQMAFLKIFSGPDQAQHHERLRRMKQRKNKHHPNILTLLRVEQHMDKEFCGVMCRLYCFYEYFDQDLQCVYAERAVKKQRFTEQELMEIAASCVNGLIYIQDNELKRSYLSKKSIVYVRRTVKILDEGIVKQPHPYYSLLQRSEIQNDVFLSPELMIQLSKGNTDPYISPKSDIFTLGVILLHLASLEPMNFFFDYDRCTIDFGKLHEKLEKLSYNESFKSLVRLMMTADEEERPGLLTVQEKLLNSKRSTFQFNEKSIKRVEFDFESSNSPEKKKSKTVRSSINLHNTFNMDRVKVSQQLTPTVLNIPAMPPQPKNPPPYITTKSQQRSFSDYSTILHQLNAHHVYQPEDQPTEAPVVIHNYGTTVSFGTDSPIQKMKGLMDNTSRSIEDDSTQRTLNMKYGRIAFADGTYYEGQLKNGLAHGNGIMYFEKDRVKYSGSWSENLYDGFGTLHTREPIKTSIPLNLQDLDYNSRYCQWYEGEFRQGKRQGFGSFYYSNGQKFSGCFREDKANGYGTYYRQNRSHTNGIWSNNHLQN